MTELPDWVRLQKALSVEARVGFTDLEGNQYRFSEFLCLSFGKTPNVLTSTEKRRWQDIGNQFARYSQMTLQQRQHLVADTRRFLNDLKQNTQRRLVEDKYQTEHPMVRVPKTKPLVEKQQASSELGSKKNLDLPLAKLAAVGSKNSEYLARLGLHKVRDLLYYYPRDHINYARQVNMADLVPGETVTIMGTVKRCNCFSSPRNKKLTILDIVLKDSTGQIKLSRFFAGFRYSNRSWQYQQKRRYPVGAVVAASGLVKKNKYGITLEDPELEVLEHPGGTIDSMKIGRVVPVYSLTEGVPADMVRRAIIAALPYTSLIKEPLPVTFRKEYGLMGVCDAIANIHFPQNADTLADARRRLVFDEFLYLQLGFLQRRQAQRKTQSSAVMAPIGKLFDQFNQLLPFELTGAQTRVINEILKDMESETPMNRLVQGDVGSGKTIVAVYAIIAAIQSGYQAALMAPTEVLAEQHYRKLVNWFNLLHLPVELLTGSTKVSKRRKLHSQLETGELPLLVGTHALIQDPVNFNNLGLVVIDEQHRFGVKQRARLQQKGQSPHVLTLTATPIPRTLALTLHGDLDVSQIDELPPGRQKIQTTVLRGKERKHAYDLIRREVAQGRQAYMVLPLIEESNKLDLRSVIEEHKRLSESIFPEFKVGLLHGRMNSADKDKALSAFRDNKSQIIVSTTVIEVGVDVPNATVMMIENAERFGLSQLHQLRGRVGRGSDKSYCLLVSGSNTETARQRLGVLEQSQDGFLISEMDMRFRGPGEVLGKRQSGLADFALASLVEDQEVLNLARDAAEKIILQDEILDNYPLMKVELEYRYQKLMDGTIMT
ncbi:MAG: ATP-dependent DNA helicase RecG [Moorea sp. SIO4E2]|uniref:ATP-dependent DNA helicase RecG n=1 Tax=Moorena sp. SIO4E2 TaxID=2607826 RepID=UPI0013B8923A|nr:ATP-dependent DNA helicase RecG [Moorena sp. SIO4E2]NEQ07362.1 ATP-dependent DNA helicase RecG [Moorena sp. SIO4E2]